ncbi:MAG: PEP-CTERM sorting domain-containing protein [Acidobacteriaceae bacterium]|nr:PEP-CTERM sorting domain-containing protein [Acidobacteriaceae bacterium]
MAVVAIILSSTITGAASITIDSPEMQAIFSQSSFDGTPISIRFNLPRAIVAPGLLDIKNPADLKALYDLAPDPAPTVDAFFVDQLDACGSVEPTINGLFAGCAQLPGHIFVEESDAAQLSPAPLMGHELGHNLNLQHDFFSSANLMAPFYPPGTDLTQDQVAIILRSPLVQRDSTGRRFIQITPIAIVAAPESSTLLLLSAALGALLIIKHK